MNSTRNYGRRIAEGVAHYLAAAGVTDWDRPGPEYTPATVWPTYIGPDMPATPHRLVCVTPGTMTRTRADVDTMLQIRIRGAQDGGPDEVGDMAQAVADVFYPNGFPLGHVTLGTVRAGAVIPVSELPLAADASRRLGHVINLRVRSRRPRPN